MVKITVNLDYLSSEVMERLCVHVTVKQELKPREGRKKNFLSAYEGV